MAQITWINFLHFYQPPRQEKIILQQVVKESYRPLINILKLYPDLHLTLNISGSLLELLRTYRFNRLLLELKSLARQKRIELVASAMYHPILPLLPSREIKRQIDLNQTYLKNFFADAFKPKGFYLPEMAYSPKLLPVLESYNFQWLILDEIAFPGKAKPDPNKLYQIKGSKLLVIFRQRRISKDFVPRIIKEKLKGRKKQTIISATDAELYGHWHKDRQKILTRVLKNPDLKTLTFSEYLKTLPKKNIIIRPRTCSWESHPGELKKSVPFALWQQPKNQIHKDLWRLANLSITLINRHQKDPNFYWARQHLDLGLASCSFWWSSLKRPSTFSPLTWHPDEIEKGAKDLVRAIRSLRQLKPETKLQAEKIYHRLKKNIWQKHWKITK